MDPISVAINQVRKEKDVDPQKTPLVFAHKFLCVSRVAEFHLIEMSRVVFPFLPPGVAYYVKRESKLFFCSLNTGV